MTSSQSQISLCNLSLAEIGGKTQISAFTDPSPQARACSLYYSFCFENLARAAYWNCLRKQLPLTLLQAAQGTPENPQGTTLPLPPPPYLYAYAVPSDSLACRFLVPTPPTQGSNTISPAMIPCPIYRGARGNIPFHVSSSVDNNNNPIQVVLTNLRKAQLVYTVNTPNPVTWDSEFQAAFVASLSAYLVKALAMNRELLGIKIAEAEKLIKEARIRDANEGPTFQNHLPDFIRARAGGGWDSGCGDGYGGYGGGDGYDNGYSSMPW